MIRPRVALLTGRSDPVRTGLPLVQRDFLTAITPRHMDAVCDGYPWVGGLTEGAVPLPIAAWRNAVQWRNARSGRVGEEVSARLLALGGGPLALVTGSCGLDLLAAGWVPGVIQLVIALGPVMARRPCWPGVRLVTVIGRRDFLSLGLHRARADISVPCHHMGYWACPSTRAAVAAILAGWAG